MENLGARLMCLKLICNESQIVKIAKLSRYSLTIPWRSPAEYPTREMISVGQLGIHLDKIRDNAAH